MPVSKEIKELPLIVSPFAQDADSQVEDLFVKADEFWTKKKSTLKAANENNLDVMNKLLSILTKSYENHKNIEDFQSPSNIKEYQTFCGT